jgi:uncharacterized membrane protein
MKRLTRYFLQGLLYIAPISLTVYVVYWIFSFIDNLLQTFLKDVFNIQIPGLGFIVIVVVITILGFIGQTILAKPFEILLTRFVLRIPLLKLIYSSLKDFFSAFVGKDKKFNKPVKVKLNRNDNIIRIGFITNENLSALQAKDYVAVYFPFSYTFTGETLLVARDCVEPINLPATEVMKFLMAGGIPDFKENKD